MAARSPESFRPDPPGSGEGHQPVGNRRPTDRLGRAARPVRAARVWARAAARPARAAWVRARAAARADGDLSGAVQALLAAPAGIVLVEIVVLVVWLADRSSQASAPTALRVGADLWLLGHGGRLHLPEGPVTVIPLGITAIPLLLTARAGFRFAVDAGLAPALAGLGHSLPVPPVSRRATLRRCVAGVSVPYVAIVMIVALVADDRAARTGPLSAGVGAAFVSVIGALAGIALAVGRSRRILGEAQPARGAAAAGAVAAAVYLGAGALGLAVCVVDHAGGIARGMSALRPGGVGGVGLVLTQVALLPNLVIWAAAYVTGSGFATGVAGSVSPLDVHAGAPGDLPILAAVPASPMPVPMLPLLLVVPLVAGGLLGGVLGRSSRSADAGAAVVRILVGATVCGALVMAAARLSGGTIGSGELIGFGPEPLRTGALAALGTLAGAGARAIVAGRWPRRSVITEPAA